MITKLLKGSVDNHIHCCPHINKRSTNIFKVVEQAEKLQMHSIGLMDNFSNTSGYASLISKYKPNLKIKIFGGLIMEPPSGGVNYENAKIALKYSYNKEGAKFISFPTHHTKFIARQEGRNLEYVKKCFHIPLKGPDHETLKILELIAKNNVVLNTGHLSPMETLTLVKSAKKIGVKKIIVPANNFDTITISKLKKFKVKFEFSYFFISRAINIPLTHVDGEKHKISGTNEDELKKLILEAKPENIILSSDSGVSVLPLPHISFSKFIKIIVNFGFSKKEIN